MRDIIIGARGSLLSTCQAEQVIALLKKYFPGCEFSLQKITTLGDKLKNWQRQDKGIFVKEIEEALIKGKIDLAVHSLKDLPSYMPRELILGAVTKREDPRDVLIVKQEKDLLRLKKGAVLGTSSLRRSSQLVRWRKDLKIQDLRGNLDTRIRKLKEGQFDGIVVAAAGIKRLGFKDIFFKFISPEVILPAVGQGALGIQIRKQDTFIQDLVKKINHRKTYFCASCERAFLKEISGGCRLPLGALAQIKDKRIYLDALITSIDGQRMVRVRKSSPIEEAEILGMKVARIILAKGGSEILRDVKENW